jgi:hypothetical protein
LVSTSELTSDSSISSRIRSTTWVSELAAAVLSERPTAIERLASSKAVITARVVSRRASSEIAGSGLIASLSSSAM